MVPTTRVAEAPASLDQIRSDAHPYCFVCSGSNPMGLASRFTSQPDGKVSSTFLGNCALEGYPGCLHGGVIASLLDGAMTNCLFAHGIRAFTAELNVRYQTPVISTEPIKLSAWLEDTRHGLFQLRADLVQGGEAKVRATGKFISHA